MYTETQAIAGPLQLTMKYEITALHSRLSNVLQAHWPDKLSKWDESLWNFENVAVLFEGVEGEEFEIEPLSYPGMSYSIQFAC